MTPQEDAERFDAIVVGSGYGGALVASRLAQAGRSVCVLERGTAYPPGSFPRTPSAFERAVWAPDDGRRGLFEVIESPGVDILVASGLGGGSLIGGGVLLPPAEEALAATRDDGEPLWPVTAEELAPHLTHVRDALGATAFPFDVPYASTSRAAAMRSAGDGDGLAYESTPLAIAFGPDRDRLEPGAPLGEPQGNLHGTRRYTCRLVGECSIGCNYGAKNSLDYTCLSTARAHGAVLRPGCEAREVHSRSRGFEVRYVDHLTAGALLRGQTRKVVGTRVVLAAGAFNTTRLLLRSIRQLDRMSPCVGADFATNGERLVVARDCRTDAGRGDLVDLAHGPITTSTVRVRAAGGAGLSVHDVGRPDFIAWIAPLLQRSLGSEGRRARDRHLRVLTQAYARSGGSAEEGRLMVLVNGGPAIRGTMSSPSKDSVAIDWNDETRSAALSADGPIAAARLLAERLGGRIADEPADGRLLALQPLGGCAMATTPDRGVVDPHGQVFGNPGLYVADGAAVPGPVGTGPALTIAALANRVADAVLDGRELAG